MKICFASHNQNKVEELKAVIPSNFEIVSLHDLNIEEEIIESGKTLEENSKIKARFLFEKTGNAVIADDSGLVVHALKGAPGVRSARYAGENKDDNANIDLLLTNLSEAHDRSAYFKTVITYISTLGKNYQFEGVVEGEILRTRKGTNGFGYDPIFQPAGSHISFAEMKSSEKNAISHRSKAIEKLVDFLQQNGDR
ncbi:MAG: RdgB/HAM1 family non-canonical purine NTP pyrophosphatase [Bacteroidota bacterium]